MKSFGVFFASFVTLLVLEANAQDNCPRLRARPNVHKMSQESWNRYVNAIRQLNSGTRPNKWDQLSNTHITYYDQIHSTLENTNPMFLAWHRQFLYELEQALIQIDPEVRLPYWDWSVNYSNINNDPIWQKYGKNGDSRFDNCVMQGSFGGMGVAYGSGILSSGDKCYTRKNHFNDVISGSKPEIEELINSRSDLEFTANLELVSHGRVHNGINYDFASPGSPSDPLFYAHHAFIDKIWFDRQNRYSEFTLSYSTSLSTQIPGFPGKQVWNVLDPFALCYTYVQDNYSWDIIRAQSVTLQSEVETFIPIQLDSPNSSLNSTKVAEIINDQAKDFVFKDAVAPNLNNTPVQSSNECEIYPLPNPINIEYIHMMNYNETKIREYERKNALLITEINKRCIASL
jgi:hypothetical protein